MATDLTKASLLDAAEMVFADRGFDAASIREIVGLAQANVSAVKYHFGSKAGLFRAVLERRLAPINTQRLEALDRVLARAGDRPAAVEALLEALIAPVIMRTRGESSDPRWLKLLLRSRVESGDHWESTGDLHRTMFRRFVGEFARSLPEFNEEEIAQRVFWLTGAVANAIVDTRDLNRLGFDLRPISADPESSLQGLVTFFAGAMRTSKSHHADSNRSPTPAASGRRARRRQNRLGPA